MNELAHAIQGISWAGALVLIVVAICGTVILVTFLRS